MKVKNQKTKHKNETKDKSDFSWINFQRVKKEWPGKGNMKAKHQEY